MGPETNKQNSSDAKRKRNEPRKMRKISAEYFRRAALHYLDRYNGTAQSVRQLLKRRVLRAKREGQEIDEAQIEVWIADLVTDLQRLELINDSAFALGRARSLLRAGNSLSMARLKLRSKGLTSDDIEQALERLSEESGDDLQLEAAQAYVRRRRLGWLRTDAEAQKHYQNKDLAALARRGFSYDLAQRALKDPDLL